MQVSWLLQDTLMQNITGTYYDTGTSGAVSASDTPVGFRYYLVPLQAEVRLIIGDPLYAHSCTLVRLFCYR